MPPLLPSHARRNHRPCDDDNDNDSNDNNNTSMCRADTEIAAVASLEPIEAHGGHECKEAAKVRKVWKQTRRVSNASKPYDIPPKKQKTHTQSIKIVHTDTQTTKEASKGDTDAHAAMQRTHRRHKNENVWMDNTAMQKDSVSAGTASTTSKLSACRLHKEKQKDKTRKIQELQDASDKTPLLSSRKDTKNDPEDSVKPTQEDEVWAAFDDPNSNEIYVCNSIIGNKPLHNSAQHAIIPSIYPLTRCTHFFSLFAS